MFDLVQRNWFGCSARRCILGASLPAILFLAGCVTGTMTTSTRPETVPSHIYPLPLDNVLAQAAQLLFEKGWRVQRVGNILFTNWLVGEIQSPQRDQVAQASVTGSLVGYRVFGERIDAGYCTIRVERMVATPSMLDFGQRKGGHQVEQTTTASMRTPTPVHNESRTLMSPFETLPEFAEDSPNKSSLTGVPSGMVVSQRERDTTLELELQEQIDPLLGPATRQADALAVAGSAGALADAGFSTVPQQMVNPVERPDSEPRVGVAAPVTAEQRPAALAGVWAGTFTFRGSVTGSFSGEVPVAVDGDSVEVDDFCPESGGTLTMRGLHNSAAWQGKLACSAIRMKGCPSATFTYDFVNATLNEGTLTVVAAGTVDTDIRCHDSTGDGIFHTGGPLSVAFVAHKADYVHIAVTKVKRPTLCVWPSDWEDFASNGSMAMPEPALDDAAYLGIIRAKGSRLTDIQRLLRHCRQVVLLHGQPVLMRLAVTRPHQ
jgi:hypothetical protein